MFISRLGLTFHLLTDPSTRLKKKKKKLGSIFSSHVILNAEVWDEKLKRGEGR